MSRSSCRINITLPQELLRQLDVVAKFECASRSDAVRLALTDWLRANPRRLRLISGSEPEEIAKENRPKSIFEQLTAEQRAVVTRHRKGEIAFPELLESGITPELAMELTLAGEL